eukprot:jgi/Tetstr1/438489/TSEL_027044.t1
MPKGMDILSASCKVRRYRGKAPNFLMKRHLRNLRKNTPLHKLLREVMLLNEQWEEARTAHADARTSMNPQLATNFAKTVIPAVNDKLRSNLTNYVLNEALKQPGGQQLRRNVAASDRSFTEASVGWAADQQKDGRQVPGL